MNSASLTFSGIVVGSAGRVPIEIFISEPLAVPGEMEFRCLVRCAQLLRHEVWIAGVDGNQARLLAVEFVRTMLGDARLTDVDGNAVELGAL